MGFSPAQRAAAARAGGWPIALIPPAVAVSMAENTSGDPAALGDTKLVDAEYGPSVGLWQIRSLNAQRGTGGERDEIANRDPVVNARHAYQIYKKQGWSAWTMHSNGTFKQYLAAGLQAVALIPTTVVPGVGAAASLAQEGGSVVDGIASGVDAARTAVGLGLAGAKWITQRRNMMRIAYGVIGAGLLVGAAVRFGSPAISKAASGVAAVAGPGKIISAASSVAKKG